MLFVHNLSLFMVLCDNCANLHFIKIDVEVVEAFSHNFFFLDSSLSLPYLFVFGLQLLLLPHSSVAFVELL